MSARSAPDPPSLLQRVLVLERQQGFADRAAVGGLEAFAAEQVKRAGAGPGAERVVAASAALQGYAGAERRGREAAVAGALKALLQGAPPAETARPVVSRPNPETPLPASSPAAPRTRSSSPAKPALRVVRTARDLDTPLAELKGMRKATADALEREWLRGSGLD